MKGKLVLQVRALQGRNYDEVILQTDCIISLGVWKKIYENNYFPNPKYKYVTFWQGKELTEDMIDMNKVRGKLNSIRLNPGTGHHKDRDGDESIYMKRKKGTWRGKRDNSTKVKGFNRRFSDPSKFRAV